MLCSHMVIRIMQSSPVLHTKHRNHYILRIWNKSWFHFCYANFDAHSNLVNPFSSSTYSKQCRNSREKSGFGNEVYRDVQYSKDWNQYDYSYAEMKKLGLMTPIEFILRVLIYVNWLRCVRGCDWVSFWVRKIILVNFGGFFLKWILEEFWNSCIKNKLFFIS